MPLTQATHSDLLDHLFGKATLTAPTIYVGLSSTTPTSTGGNVTEPTTGSYARVETEAADWDTAADGDPSVLDNAQEIAFPAATADWVGGSNLTHFTLHDAASDGNVIGWGELTTPKPVTNGDTARFPAGALRVRLGAVEDFAEES